MKTEKRRPSNGKPNGKPDNKPDRQPGFLSNFLSALLPGGLVAVITGLIGFGFALFEIPIAIISALASGGIGGVISLGSLLFYFLRFILCTT